MNLPDYIRAIGEDVAAAKFGVSVWTIRSWRQRTRFPRANKANEIVAMTDGIVGLDGIYAPESIVKKKAA
jgi:uncharacterized protein YjcR